MGVDFIVGDLGFFFSRGFVRVRRGRVDISGGSGVGCCLFRFNRRFLVFFWSVAGELFFIFFRFLKIRVFLEFACGNLGVFVFSSILGVGVGCFFGFFLVRGE